MNHCALKSMARKTGMLLLEFYIILAVIKQTWDWFFAGAFERYAMECCQRYNGTIYYGEARMQIIGYLILFCFLLFFAGALLSGLIIQFHEWYKSEAKACESKKGKR